jgi:hypothetical protein
VPVEELPLGKGGVHVGDDFGGDAAIDILPSRLEDDKQFTSSRLVAIETDDRRRHGLLTPEVPVGC